MNHGYCKNCWWCKPLQGPQYVQNVIDYRIVKVEWCGLCYMHNGDYAPCKLVKDSDYCPDYVNRKAEEKKHGTLEDWIKST